MSSVVIAGAGPVGLVSALFLARRGVTVTVIEASDGPGSASRASTFHPPTLELLDELGVTALVIERGLRAATFQHRDRRDGLVAEFDLEVLSDQTRYPFRIQLEQDKFCTLMAELLADEPNATLLTGKRVVSTTQTDLAVTVEIEGGETFTGDWAIGADGASSMVRKSLPVEFEGLTYDQRFLVVSTPFAYEDVFEGLAFVNYISDPDEWVVLLRTPDHWRVLFPVEGDDLDAFDDATEAGRGRIQQRLKSLHDPGHDLDVLGSSAYRIHQRVASTFRHGRVLLAGDAAHLNNPLGGMGMNSGIQDAFALCKRLALVIDGTGPDSLLDDYARLRRDVALEVVDRASRRNLAELSETDPAKRAERQDHLRATAADPALAAEYLLGATMLPSARATCWLEPG